MTRNYNNQTPRNDGSLEQLVLVILDDEPEVAGTLAMMAERSGVSAYTTCSVEAFFEALSEYSPSHIALDLMMPAVDGIMILERLHREGCTANLIIASGADARVLDASVRTASEYGLNVLGTLKKPFSSGKLRAMLSLSEPHERAPTSTPTLRASPIAGIPAVIGSKDLTRALKSGVIQPHFQPKVGCDNGHLVGFEALARWHCMDPNPPGPDIFIALAEQSGQIDLLTENVMTQSIHWFSECFSTGDESIAINVSAKSLTDNRVLDLLEHLCDTHSLDINRIVLEVTESGALGKSTDQLKLLTRMRLKGIGLSIDDFGTGYSSIEQLARLPFSELKIDKRFVGAVCHSHEARTIVQAIIGMAKGLDLRTVAEGVEDLVTFNYLQDHECDVAQGYFIGRPMAPSDAAKWATSE